MKHFFTILLFVMVLYSCGESGKNGESETESETGTPDKTIEYPDDDGSLATNPIRLDGECPLQNRLGDGFKASVGEEYSVVDGKVTDSVLPISILEEIGREGKCKLLKRNNPYCDPGCDPSSEVCDLDGKCVAVPRNQDVGTVSITGMKKYIKMEPRGSGNNYFDSSDLPFPLFEEGEEIKLRSTDGKYGVLKLDGYGVAKMESDIDALLISEDTPLKVSWNKPGENAKSHIVLKVKIDQHGLSPIELRCVFEDTGEGEISADLLKVMLDSGVSGYPNGKIIRRTVDSMDVQGGCVEFSVMSELSIKVRVSGSTPCKNDSECPEGGVCNKAREICE